MDFSVRSYQKELLDRDDIPFTDIRQNMLELDRINTLLGGHAITIKGFLALRASCNHLNICEIGCGGGDNLRAIHEYCQRKKIPVQFLGIDINADCIEVAKQNSQSEGFEFVVSDYRNYSFENGKPDIIFSSLFCHHFNETELVEMILWMNKNSKRGFFINDLHRHPFAYYSIRLLTRLFSKSYLVRNDAPLSVLRGFSRKEWQNIFDKSGIHPFRIRWNWAFRWLVTVTHNQN